ncbi:MAG: hypothetical protein ACKVS9_01855 [Phycisphaerae bacterium]
MGGFINALLYGVVILVIVPGILFLFNTSIGFFEDFSLGGNDTPPAAVDEAAP